MVKVQFQKLFPGRLCFGSENERDRAIRTRKICIFDRSKDVDFGGPFCVRLGVTNHDELSTLGNNLSRNISGNFARMPGYSTTDLWTLTLSCRKSTVVALKN